MKTLPTIAWLIALAVSAAMFFGSCESTDTAPGASAPSARAANPHAEGKRLYMTRCTSCHAAEPIGDYSAAEWRELMPEMAEESKLTAAQERAVLAYVLSGG